VDEDVGLEMADEQQRQGLGVGAGADDPGLGGPLEVGGEDTQGAARRRFLRRGVEGDDERGLPGAQVHLHGDGGANHVLQEGDELLGEAPEHDPGVGIGRNAGQLDDGLGQEVLPGAHGREEELLLRGEVAQDRGGGDVQGAGDVGQGRRVEPALDEGRSGGVEDLCLGDARWAAH
jgi:hypothetical protein